MELKKFLIFLFFVGVVLGCSRDDEVLENSQYQNDMEESADDVRYYVKYEVYMPYGGFSVTNPSRIITITTENGLQSFSVSEAKWEGTYGPFKKGNELSLQVKVGSGPVFNQTDSYVRLSVCRNKEPFVVKGEQRGRGVSVLYTSYVIDY